jgi:hypothetical protein
VAGLKGYPEGADEEGAMAIIPTTADAAQAGPVWPGKPGAARSGAAVPGADGAPLPPGEAAQVAKLKARDAQVRAHEAAHLAAAGSLAEGGATYTYQRGPDGRAYAVGGEVNIDAGSVPGDPEASQAKAMRVVAAALAPADPSGQDLAVAARAREAGARAESQAGAEQRAAAGQPGPVPGRHLDLMA